MPKLAKYLGSMAVSGLAGDGLHPVGGVAGLSLKIDGGSRSWVLRVMVAGHRRHIGLGAYPGVGLADARRKAQEARDGIRQGVDPLRERAAALAALKAARVSAITFQRAARDYIDAHESSWRNAKHGAQWLSTLETWAFPRIGALLVEDIQTSHVLDLLTQRVGDEGQFWTVRAETASRVRQRIEAVIAAADAAAGRERLNPARLEVIKQTLPRTAKVKQVEHHPALPWQQVPGFLSKLSGQSGTAARALAWTVLTAARSGETLGSTWCEVDTKGKVWTIPADRMKAGRVHRVPLTDAALALLGEPGKKGDLLFPAPRGGRFSGMAMMAVIRRMHDADLKAGGTGYTDPNAGGRTVTAHGFRSSFRDWAGESTGHPREVVEAALAHAVENATEAVYARGDLFARRAVLMGDWASFCTRPAAGDVVAIGSARVA